MTSDDWRRREKFFIEAAQDLKDKGMSDEAEKFYDLATFAEAEAVICGRYERQGYDRYTLERVRVDDGMTTEDKIVVSLIWLAGFCLIGAALGLLHRSV
jgi:hypothetical protein